VLEHAALSNDVAVSEAGEGDGRGIPQEGTGEQVPEDAGVLSNLPRTRPQRASARRSAARRADAAASDAGGAADTAAANGNGRAPRAAPRKATAGKRTAAKARKTATAPSRTKAPRAKPAKTARKHDADAVPRQGYESVEERATGPVQPPGGTELIGTAAEIVSEIAKAGLSGGERVVRDVLSRLGR